MWGMKCSQAAWKNAKIFLNLEGHVHGQGCTHAQEIPEKALISDLWLTLRLCTSRK